MLYSLKDRQQKATYVFLRALEKEHLQRGGSYKSWRARKIKLLAGRDEG
jgi:hypothetical protein